MFCIEATKASDLPKIEEMLDQSFGVDRQNKTAYRLRDGVPTIEELSLVLRKDGALKATLQFWPIIIKDNDSGKDYDALLLGPIAVEEACRGQGMGLALMEYGLARAEELGHSRVVLVGDEPYYRKLGFCRRFAEGLSMPGPVDINRLLAYELVPGSFDGVKGIICKIK